MQWHWSTQFPFPIVFLMMEFATILVRIKKSITFTVPMPLLQWQGLSISS
jgi:hypothetical protein